jgi:hypothetical protein
LCFISAVLFVAEAREIRPARARVGWRSRIVVEITDVRGKGVHWVIERIWKTRGLDGYVVDAT